MTFNNQQLAKMDHACLWHPFTPMQQYLAGEPIIITQADGFELIDSAGLRYIDGFSSLWCNLHGHRVEKIDSAIRRQLGQVAHSTLLGLTNPTAIELAHKLVQIAPPPEPSRPGLGLTKVFFSDSGSSAVEVALKMAFQYHRNIGDGTAGSGKNSRRKFIAFRDAYHGDTIGSVSVGGIDIFHKVFSPLLFETTLVASPNEYYHPAGPNAGLAVLAEIEAILSKSSHEYCGLIIEPLIQAAAGMLTHPPGFLRTLSELVHRFGLLLIADEVATGFCRTGSLFACQQENVCPDLLCLGKGLTGGYLPVSATLTSQAIFDSFLGQADGTGYAGRTFFHGHTFSGNALGCAAGNASIDLIFKSNLPANLPAKVQLIKDSLAHLTNHPNVGDIRQCGMMAGIDLVEDRSARQNFDPARQMGFAVCQAAMKRGIMIRPLGDVVVLMPAPAMDLATLDKLLTGVIESINETFPAAY
jgi:adenosylmethionine-8-amino-7-oxononanoate aminotransferase